jgi:hypothetical protein
MDLRKLDIRQVRNQRRHNGNAHIHKILKTFVKIKHFLTPGVIGDFRDVILDLRVFILPGRHGAEKTQTKS